MPEDSFKTLLFGAILVALFGMLIMTAVNEMGVDYGKDTSLVVGGNDAMQGFNQSIKNVQSSAESFSARFESGSVWSVLAGVVVDGVFGIAKDMTLLIIAPFRIISALMVGVFGVPTYVTGVIIGLLILSIIFAVWRLIKIGD